MKLDNITEAVSIIAKLERTRKSLSNHVGRGNRINGQRSMDLVDKYTELKDQATKEEWLEFCNKNRLSPDHDAYDLFA